MSCISPGSPCDCRECQEIARQNQASADNTVLRARLSKTDWALIREALEMLDTDYEEQHPEQSRLNFLLRYASIKEGA